MKVTPAVIAFLKERGLELSEEKTRITILTMALNSSNSTCVSTMASF